MLNSHYSGRLKGSIDRLHKLAPKKFYEIFNSYNLYDVRDENNGLTPEQRASVAVEDQKLYTDISNALADMLYWYLGDSDKGLATKSMQEIVDKLDVRASANAAKIDTIGNSISTIATAVPVLAPLNAINGAQQLAGAQVASVMGTSIFDPDMIPPINFGLSFSLPGNVANVYKPGFFNPNWDFLYNFEYKNPKFYFTGTGGLKVGPNIDVASAPSELWLKQVFSVSSVSEELTPVGDPIGGISFDEYQTLLKVRSLGVRTSTNDPSIYLNNAEISNFSLNDTQMRSIFYKLVDTNLWKPINNRKNWVNGHWGALGHNSCPDPIRTAVCSFIWDTGLAIQQSKNDEAALISYCLQMGLYYLTGFKYKVRMTGIESVNVLSDGQTINPGETKVVNGVPRNKNVANRYFCWIADILSRTTHNINGDTIALDKRKRRIAEANLIYTYLGMPIIEFGTPISELPYVHTAIGLRDRKFDKLIESSVYRYENEGAPGGSGNKHSIQDPQPSTLNITYGASVNKESITDYSIKVIKNLFSSAGVTDITITSAARNAKEQARVMFQNLERGNRIDYKEPGQEVVSIYDEEKPKGTPDVEIKRKMEERIKSLFPRLVSKHTVPDVEIVNVIDIAPSSINPPSKRQLLEEILTDNVGTGKLLEQFLGPRKDQGNDPAYHLVIPQQTGIELEFINDALPDVIFTLRNNPNFKSDIAWLAPLAKDRILKDGGTKLG